MKILGISPLDKDCNASLVEDGRVLFAAGEERFSRVKQHAGFPHKSIQAALNATGTDPREIDVVAYPFLEWQKESELILDAVAAEEREQERYDEADLQRLLAEAERRIPERKTPVHGLSQPNQRKRKGTAKELFYRYAGGERTISRAVALRAAREWAGRASEDHKKWHTELEDGLRGLGLLGKLKRSEHHLSHAANAYLASGFDRAVIVTIDGYGSGLAGSVSIGEGGRIRRLHNLKFPHSLGSFYEMVTSSLGFHPDRHAGKIVGLAAYGDPRVLSDVLLSRVVRTPGDFRLIENLNVHFSRHLAARFPMIDVAAAYQHVLEVVATDLVRHWVRETGCGNVVLSGGVTANVKMNQRIHEIDEVEQTFVYPNMGDGGCGTGLAMLLSWPGGVQPSIRDVYWGPSYSEAEIKAELEKNGLAYDRPTNLVEDVARRIHGGEVIGRFDGRMEYGPRALGNRSILYHAREPEVNQWLNKRLGRTEFMPFAPVTLWEARERCYVNLEGAEHTAEFMTVTFDCTPWMRQNCPAAVHVDGTARPQLVKREVNPGYWDLLSAYEKISGIPCLINTSFNMHEEPIVCSPNDAVRAFLLGNIDGLAIGPFFVAHPSKKDGAARSRQSAGSAP
ncbi:MAG: carbamoyltransferase [Planctomycetota bacterium]|nr:carbamoyltransferase [Planctomycetota bacterium]